MSGSAVPGPWGWGLRMPADGNDPPELRVPRLPPELTAALKMAHDPEAVIASMRASECEPHPFEQEPGLAPGVCWCHTSADARWHRTETRLDPAVSPRPTATSAQHPRR